MKLSVGTNWDTKLIDVLSNTPEVYEVYGSASATPIGNGRPSFILGKIANEDMASYITKIHEKGLKFNYTLNAPCLNNLEYNNEAHKELIEQLDWLVSIGIDGVTVSIPYLLEIVKKRFPSLSAKVSIIAQVNSVQKAKFFENLGADEIMLDYMINRDFKLLENIKKSVNCKLSLLLNDACIYGCPYRYYHYNICGHASQVNHQTKGFYIDYCAIRCTIERLRDPNLLISSRWIRPEDIKSYEDIGYDSFKVSGRRMSTNWIKNAVNAYVSRDYDGNLSSILDYSILGMEEEVHSPEFETIISGAVQLKTDTFMKLAQFEPKKPYINNKSLDGFIKYFINKGCSGICNECNYCRSYAQKALKLDEKEMQSQLDTYESLLEDLTTSKMFLGKENKEEAKMKEETIEIVWSEKLKADFEHVISFAPEALRSFARDAILKAINENVVGRGDNEVIEEDMVNAFLVNTPAFFRNDMLNSLRELGIDLSKYPV
ncbi:MAG TPA: U32 family peptidase [Pseudobacteroides sp.]|mgnify:CR=1 FL=1|nr:U32 family peptidase [Pseudobacteroides sp.]